MTFEHSEAQLNEMERKYIGYRLNIQSVQIVTFVYSKSNWGNAQTKPKNEMLKKVDDNIKEKGPKILYL